MFQRTKARRLVGLQHEGMKRGLTLGRGFFGHGDMQKEFETAAFQLQPGQMSGIVESQSGLHLIQRYVTHLIRSWCIADQP